MSSRLCSQLSAPVVLALEGVASGAWHGQLLPLPLVVALPLLLIAC